MTRRTFPLSLARAAILAALAGLPGTVQDLSAAGLQPRTEPAPGGTRRAPILLGWVTNIVRNQGADSLEYLQRSEAPGSNLVVLGSGGFYLVESTVHPERNHFSMDSTFAGGGDPNINQYTFARTLAAAHRLGLRVVVGLPIDSEIRRKLQGGQAYGGAYSPLDSLQKYVRFVMDRVEPEELAGWFVGDEPNLGVGYPGNPNASRYAPFVLDSMVARIRAVDPDSAAHPIMPILFGAGERDWNPAQLRRYYLGHVADRLMVDGYLSGGDDDFSSNTPASSAALEALPLRVAPAMNEAGGTWYAVLQGWNISRAYCALDPWQSCPGGDGTRSNSPSSAGSTGSEVDSIGSGFGTSEAQLRYQALSCLVHGASGVLFYQGGFRDALSQTGPPYATAGFRKRAVSPVIRLLGGRPTPGAPLLAALDGGADESASLECVSGGGVSWTVRRAGAGEARYVIAVNDGRLPATCYWDPSGYGAGWSMAVYSRAGEGEQPASLDFLAPAGRYFRDRLEPHGSRIYVLAPDSTVGHADTRIAGPGDVASRAWSVVPNPSRDVSAIRFSASATGNASASVYDLNGRRILAATWNVGTPGVQDWVWDGRDERGLPVPTGIYFCRVGTARQSRTLKILRVR